MNERIQELARQAQEDYVGYQDKGLYYEIFAKLIIEDACRALNPMLRDMISRGQGVDLIKQHFGIEE